MQIGVVAKANRSSGVIRTLEGQPLQFCREDQYKKQGERFIPVEEPHRYFPKPGKQVEVIEKTPDGQKAAKWRLL